MTIPPGPYGPYHAAVAAVLDAKRECWCEYVDIGVGDQKVAEHPECPRCTREGEAAWYLEKLTPGIVAVERERFDTVLVQALTLPVWGDVEDELVKAFRDTEASVYDGVQAVYGEVLEMLAMSLVQARAKMAGDE